MKNLIYKELKLSINKFFYLLPILLAALMFIPEWIYVLIFMYFFWITMPQIYSAYQAQKDYSMMAMLPIRRKDIAVSKAFVIIILELYHVVLGVIFAIIHNILYGSHGLFFDLNPSFFGYILLMYGIFNISFLPGYFKSAYFFGKPLIIGVITTFIFVTAVELLNIFVGPINQFLETSNVLIQSLNLVVCVIVFAYVNYVAIRKAAYNYENI